MNLLPIPDMWSGTVCVASDVSPDEKWFSREELAIARSLERSRRRADWLSSRMAAKVVALERKVSDDPCTLTVDSGKNGPRLSRDGTLLPQSVSLSHSRGFGAAAVSDSDCGIDIEHVRALVPRIYRFFLTPAEILVAHGLPTTDSFLHLWCVKEAAWKIARPNTIKQVAIVIEDATADSIRVTFEANDTKGSVNSVRLSDTLIAALALKRST